MKTVPHQASQFLYREGSIAYYILGSDLRDSALALGARFFSTEPSSIALSKLKPEHKTTFLDLVEFIEYFIDSCCSNGLSVIVIDERNHRIIAMLLVKDVSFFPEDFLKKYKSYTNAPLVSFVKMRVLELLEEEAIKNYQALKNAEKPGFAADFWLLGVDPDYRRQNLSQKMFECALPLVKNKGFAIVTGETTGDFSARVFRNNSFNEVAKYSAKDFIWNGEKVYQLLQPPHGEWRYWVKNLNKVPLIQSKL